MKKIFTLIAMALMAVGANAQSSWVAPESAPAAGMSIIKDDLMKVETACFVLSVTQETKEPRTIGQRMKG